MRIKDRWRSVRDWCGRARTNLRPFPEERKGAQWGALLLAFAIAVVAGIYLQSGFGRAFDIAFTVLVAAIAVPLITLLVVLLLTLARKLPRVFTGILIGTCALAALALFPELGILVGAILLLIECILGATIATFLAGHFREAHTSKKIVTVTLFVAALAANAGIFVFLASAGNDKDVLRIGQVSSPDPPSLAVPDPSQPGPNSVLTVFYGNGSDIRRPEYGKSVAIKTKTIDGSLFFKDFKGWKEKLRRRYWGFGLDKMPLNARVWYPQGDGPFPLALIVHGNHNMTDFSDPGYEYLGQLLASRGFILASVDENFLNGWVVGPEKEQAVRGWLLLEHLKLWREWNETSGSIFYHKVDVNNVALLGHSRGGEAVATAALFNTLAYYPDDGNIRFDYHYPIRSLVAIAPVDGQYKPAGESRRIRDVSYFTLQGANDSDVSSFNGSRQWDHVSYSGDGDFFKAELYIYGANHGQFNTRWGRSDVGHMLGWFLNQQPLLAPEAQRQIAKTYISAFLEATLHGNRGYRPLFRDYRVARNWLPKTYYMSRYQDPSYQAIAKFSEDPDLTTATIPGGRISASNLSIWKEGRIPYRQGDRGYNGVFLGWNRAENAPVPAYSIMLPDGFQPPAVLTLSLAVTDQKAPLPGKRDDEDKDKKDKKDKKDEKTAEITDFTVELETTDGARTALPLSRFGALLPPFKVRFTKLQLMDDFAYEKSSEPAFQTFEIPLAAFANFDRTKLHTVRLKFDRTPMRVIILSQVGFEDQ
jgi:dienelactone hydrolase